MVHSVEEYLMKKIGLEKLEYKDRPEKAINYFDQIMRGAVQTSPYELMIMFNLLFDLQRYDKGALMTRYLVKNERVIYDFFRIHFQRFNYFEFKPLIAKVKGVDADKSMINEVLAKSAEKIEKVGSEIPAMLLDNNPTHVQQLRKEAAEVSTMGGEDMVNVLGEKIKQKFREVDLELLRKVEDRYIPSVQLEFNKRVVAQLEDFFIKKESGNIVDIFKKIEISLADSEKMLLDLSRQMV